MPVAIFTIAWLVASSHVSPTIRLLLFAATVITFVNALRKPPSVKLVFAYSAIVLCVATVLMPRDSGDVYMYGMFGSVAGNHHANPYTHAPQEYPDDPLLQPTVEQWRHVRSPYGPAFTVMSAGVARVAHDSPMLAVRFFQGIDAIAVFGVAVLLFRRFKDLRIAVFIALNPALAAIVNGGHNDILVASALVGAALSKRFAWLFLALAVCLKITAALPVAAFLLWRLWASHPAPVRETATNSYKTGRFTAISRTRVEVATAALTTLVCVVAYAIPGFRNVLSSLNDSGMVTSRASIWSLPHALLGKTGLYALIALVMLIAFVKLRRYVTGPVFAMALAAIVEVFLFPYVLPWYAATAIFLAAITRNEKLMFIAAVQSLALTMAYTVPPGEHAAGLFAVISAAAFPLALLSPLRGISLRIVSLPGVGRFYGYRTQNTRTGT